MANLQNPSFEQFVAQRKKDLQRIARHTQGEHQLSDVINEAWLVACEPWRSFQLRRTPEQLAFDFDDEMPLQWEPLMP